MRLLPLTCIMLLSLCFAHGQVGIGTPTPNPAAVLDINAQINSTQYGGLKLPTVTSAQRALIQTPIPDGLMIYHINGMERCLELYDTNLSAWVQVYCMNSAPEASAVNVTGTFEVEETLSPSFTVTDPESDPLGTHTFQWFRADDVAGTNSVAITGATALTYTLQEADAARFISFQITPVATAGASPGLPVQSTRQLVSFKPVVVAFNQQTQSLAENNVPNTVALQFTLSNRTYAAINVAITASAAATGRLTQGTASQTAVIPAGTAAGVFTINVYNIQNNTVADGNANITFTLNTVTSTSGVASRGTPITDTLQIVDDETVPVASDLFISEYVEGSGNNKYIEIANFTGTTVNLAGYSLRLHANGATTVTSTVNLTGTLANGAVLVFANSAATIYTGITTNTAVANFNGDDAISLVNGATLIDVFGRIGQDPGTLWVQGGNRTLDRTLVRRPGFGPNNSNVDNFPALATEWIEFPIDTVSNLGSHTF